MSSRPPEFFQPTSPGAWLGFGLFFTVLACFFPWLWGLLIGVLWFYGFFYFFYKMMGGGK